MSRREKKKDPLGIRLVGGLEEEVTGWAGAALLVGLGRKCGMIETAERVLPKKTSGKGLSSGQTMESFIMLSALGGECIEDMERLREDEGLVAMLGYVPPAVSTARQWLDRFHDETVMRERPLQGAFLPTESKPLTGLNEVNRRVIWAYIQAVQLGEEVTLDVDAQLVQTWKDDAKYCYEGYKAFQPIEVVWAQTGLVMADEFREGNVPASKDIQRMVDEAYGMLPEGQWRVKVRSDSAGYEQKNLDHWQHQGWQFAVSADMSPQLKREIEALPEEAWRLWKEEGGGMIREWAEVPFIPGKRVERKGDVPYRYVAIRIRPQQGKLFEDGNKSRHFAVVTNIWDLDGQALLEWHRGKAGTIEHIHHVLDNELAAGVYPSGKHGANAAWLRLQAITNNLLQLLKATMLPPEYAKARPKRLRYAVFSHIGRVVRHGGQVLLRVTARAWESLIQSGYIHLLRLDFDTG